MATDTVTMVSAPASAATVATIAQVVPARAIAMATAFATTTNAIATPDSGERIVAMRLCGPDCMHGECIDNKCICFKGFVGRDCDTRTCGGEVVLDPETVDVSERFTKPFCSGHGVCSVDHRCECDMGFTGEICELRACPEIALRTACV